MNVIYRGHRDGTGAAWIEVLTGPDVIGTVLPHRVLHSPTGLEWGYGGSGPADTARSILAFHLGFVPHPAIYQRFKFTVIAGLAHETWQLETHDIAQALADIQAETGIRCLRCRDVGVCNDGEGHSDAWCSCEVGELAREQCGEIR